MRILFVADGRSPIARSWIQHWIARGDEVHLASTFACDPPPGLAGLTIIPVALSGARAGSAGAAAGGGRLRGLLSPALRARLRAWIGPLTLTRSAARLAALARALQPDLVHALRIPFEGMLAANAGLRPPLIVSVWGNDFTLHAPASPFMRQHTRWTLVVSAGLHADCQRDVRLAHTWGLPAEIPTLVIPGNGGLDLNVFHPPAQEPAEPLVLNPRGVRAYVRNDTFFRAIPLVLQARPDAKFICPAMAGDPEAERWLDRLGIRAAVRLLPAQPREALADLYRQARVLVSPSTHDGTPNSLLEGMACGCLPVAGDLESIREWITPGENGLLVDPADPQDLAQAILRGLEDGALRAQARRINGGLIAERAEYGRCMQAAEAFYRRVLGG